MSAKYVGYPEYKDSGVEWLGEIPKHWERKRIKETARLINGYPFDSKKFEAGKGTPLVRIRDIRTSKTEVGVVGEIPSMALINNGDVLIGMDGDFNVALWSGGEAALNQRVACIRAEDYNLQKFLYYVSPFNMKVVNDLTYFTTVKHLSSIDILKTVYALPPEGELDSIVSFLDHETTKIDTLIEKQQQLIKLLKEKRQAVISHAVTKGINANVPMRDSGVEWLGEVPEHWEVARFKYLVSESAAGPYGSSLTKSMYTASGIRVYGQQQVIADDLSIGDYYISEAKFKEMRRYEVYPNDVLISVMGTVGKVAVVPKSIERGIINPRLVKYKVMENKILPQFVKASILCDVSQSQLLFSAQGSTMDGLNMQILGELPIPHPPGLEEQKEIINEIKRQGDKFDNILSECLVAVELLKERRTALISAAVTGKIDVRLFNPKDELPQVPLNHKEASV
ncbi:MAG: restriction endonuclease subunit S [Oceanospirillaceae bacterium]|nr:restriction endonuclease subunit S [Oceanospirillaceae bacterium]